MKRFIVAMLCFVAAAVPLSARAGDATVSLDASDLSATEGQLVRVVATIDVAGEPQINQEVTWSVRGTASLVVQDFTTNAVGQARAIVRGYSFGTDPSLSTVTATAGPSNEVCTGEGAPCAQIDISWAANSPQCKNEGFGAMIGGAPVAVDPLANLPVVSGPCYFQVDRDATVGDAGTVQLLNAHYDSAYGMSARAASVVVAPLVIDVAEASSRTTCDGAAKAHQELHTGLVTIRDIGGEVLFRQEPAPNTVIAVPGVASITLNEQTSQAAGAHAEGSVNAVHVRFLSGAPDAIVSHAATSGTCTIPIYETLLGVTGDAHTDYATGPAHVRLETYADPFGGAPFLYESVQYSDARADPPGFPGQPFTCYDGTPSLVLQEEPEQGGEARAVIRGTITCSSLTGVAAPFDFTLHIEDINTFDGPVDFYDMTLEASGESVYQHADFTSEGTLSVGFW